MTILGFGYALYSLTSRSNISTNELPEIVDLERYLYLLSSITDLQHLLRDFLAGINTNFNHYTYSELTSIYDSLNQIYVEINGCLDNLDYLGESISSYGGSYRDEYIQLVSNLHSDHNSITELLKQIEPRIDAYEFFSKFYLD